MSDPHEHAATAPALPFSEVEWKEFHDNDIHAGAAIILLMTGIFSIGLVLYTTIAIIVSQ
jgi:hypothetical protein